MDLFSTSAEITSVDSDSFVSISAGVIGLSAKTKKGNINVNSLKNFITLYPQYKISYPELSLYCLPCQGSESKGNISKKNTFFKRQKTYFLKSNVILSDSPIDTYLALSLSFNLKDGGNVQTPLG